jgi:hypothetical protein
VAALDQLNKYFSLSEMFIPTGNYWNEVHGMLPGEAAGDAEGEQCLRLLGANMAWLLHVMERGRDGLPLPPPEAKIRMNFIR